MRTEPVSRNACVGTASHCARRVERLHRQGRANSDRVSGRPSTMYLLKKLGVPKSECVEIAGGGCVKFDLKAYRETLHIVLTGGSNRRTLDNFARAARRFNERPSPPLVVASTLLVPGYNDATEVGHIARFIADLNPDIPYALLGFAPHPYMSDLPCTSFDHAARAEAAARAVGLANVHVTNRHLLSNDYVM